MDEAAQHILQAEVIMKLVQDPEARFTPSQETGMVLGAIAHSLIALAKFAERLQTP